MIASMKSTIVKSFLYLLSTTTFSQEDCNKLMRPVLNTVCSKVKISRKFHLDLCYGLLGWLELGLDNLYVHQGLKKEYSL